MPHVCILATGTVTMPGSARAQLDGLMTEAQIH